MISLFQVSGVVLNINMYKEVTDPNTGVIKFQTINLESTEKVDRFFCAKHNIFIPGRLARSPSVHPIHDKRPSGDEEEQGAGFKHNLCLRLP